MAFDIKKSFNTALLPAVALSVIWIILQMVSYFLPDSLLQLVISPSYFLLQFLVYVWIGIQVIKKEGTSVWAALTGALVGALSGIADLIMMVIFFLVFGISSAAIPTNLSPTLIILALAFGGMIAVTINAISGAFGGALGAFITARKVKK
ncbi:MAG: hypothetical protein NTY68_03055 [Candidatus Micrarchaeota archaeon]|nr:hypothetical protein [Candidatus Micrarchaeota archaeon]